MQRVILAVDPGRQKCGIAVLQDGAPPTCVHREIVATTSVVETVLLLVQAHGVTTIVVGDATGSRFVFDSLRGILSDSLPVESVSEQNTTQEARKLYWEENPPKGWRRLLPPSLSLPPRPWDDYAALILGKKRLNSP